MKPLVWVRYHTAVLEGHVFHVVKQTGGSNVFPNNVTLISLV